MSSLPPTFAFRLSPRWSLRSGEDSKQGSFSRWAPNLEAVSLQRQPKGVALHPSPPHGAPLLGCRLCSSRAHAPGSREKASWLRTASAAQFLLRRGASTPQGASLAPLTGTLELASDSRPVSGPTPWSAAGSGLALGAGPQTLRERLCPLSSLEGPCSRRSAPTPSVPSFSYTLLPSPACILGLLPLASGLELWVWLPLCLSFLASRKRTEARVGVHGSPLSTARTPS